MCDILCAKAHSKQTYIVKWIHCQLAPTIQLKQCCRSQSLFLHGKYIRTTCVGVCLCWIPRTNVSHILKVPNHTPEAFVFVFWVLWMPPRPLETFHKRLIVINLNILQAGCLKHDVRDVKWLVYFFNISRKAFLFSSLQLVR